MPSKTPEKKPTPKAAGDGKPNALQKQLQPSEELAAVVGSTVSGGYGPLAPSAEEGGSCESAQHQGISSSIRSLGQPLTRRVSRSVK